MSKDGRGTDKHEEEPCVLSYDECVAQKCRLGEQRVLRAAIMKRTVRVRRCAGTKKVSRELGLYGLLDEAQLVEKLGT